VAIPQPTPFFDANAILGPVSLPPPGAPETVSDLLATMDHYGLQRALVTHSYAKWHQPAIGNARLMRELAGHDRLTACWVVMPSATGEVPPEPEQIAQLVESGARAARLCPVAHKIRFEPWVIDPLLRALAERPVPLFLDFDTRHWSEELPWAAIERTLRLYPALPVVLLRLGHADLRTLFPLLDRCPNLYVETSYFQGHDAIRLLAERWGANRLLFGSGLPFFDPGLPITGVTYAGLSRADRDTIASGTLETLLGLSVEAKR
jgi:predicted TIM-barrel fold metal-dependent hydrolase